MVAVPALHLPRFVSIVLDVPATCKLPAMCPPAGSCETRWLLDKARLKPTSNKKVHHKSNYL